MAEYFCPVCGAGPFTTMMALTKHKLTHKSPRKGI